MTIISSTIRNNGAIGGGGGIHNAGAASIVSSAILWNSACMQMPETGVGGGVYNDGQLIIVNSTLSGNRVCGGGAGGAIYSPGILTVTNTTLSDNRDNLCCSECWLHNTILAGGGDCSGAILDGGHNIDSDGTCGFDPENGSIPNTDPLLDELADNGGPTLTYALLPVSPAIDAADPAHCPPTDQRGISRPFDGDGDGVARCDIGSFEYDGPPPKRRYLPLALRS
jgi:hypothetical protein